MDFKNWKRALAMGLVSAATCTSPSAFAAQANVAIDIDFPTILVMYHHNTITKFRGELSCLDVGVLSRMH